jgi:polyferredoxin
MVALVIVFVLGIPGAVLGYDIWFFARNITQYRNLALVAVIGLAAVAAASLIVGVAVMAKYVCAVCVNFSCPFNRDPKVYVDAYLKQNPVMQRAWEERSYRLDNEHISER